MTQYWTIDPEKADREPGIREAGTLLAEGKLVAFPTETVYGLGADARSTEAVEGIFHAKGRPADNPLIVHIADRSQLDDLVDRLDETSSRLMDVFWPGPLTLVLPVKTGAVSPRVTAGLATVGVRMPDHPAALALIRAAGCPVAAPSANCSGRPSPTGADHVRDDLDGVIAGIVDGGPTGIGVESTVVEAADGVVHVLRPGGVSAEELQRAVPGVRIIAAPAEAGGIAPLPGSGESGAGADSPGVRPAPSLPPDAAAAPEPLHAPKAPGMKYTHYAPRGRLSVVQSASPERAISWIRQEIARAKAAGEQTGVLACAEHAGQFAADTVVVCGSLADPASTARELFGALRRFDEAGATFILAEAFPTEGIGAAIMNRLGKAAGGRIIRV